MKPVLLVSEFWPPASGGIQRSLTLLAPAWGDDVQVITPAQQKTYPGLNRSLFSGRWRPRWLWLIPEFWRRARRGRRLIIFGHYSAAVTAAWMLRPVGVRYVILAHGNDVLVEQGRWTRVVLAAQFRQAEWVGVNSAWLAKIIRSLGIVSAKIVRTHPAVADDELIDHQVARADQMIISVARLVPRKNISTILEAVATLVKRWPGLQYHIVGDGPERAALQVQAETLRLQSHVVWHGRTTDINRRELLRRASIFALVPTVRDGGRDVEGLGAVYLEAMAAGLPIVAAPTGGVPDAVRHEVNGLAVDPLSPMALADALENLLANPERRQAFGHAGRRLVEEEFRAGIRTTRARHLIQGWSPDDQPKISVIIPAYQSAASIGATLDSVWRQTWKHLEVIVVDDGSTDDLESALKPYRDNITVITQANAGAPAARNAGAAAATGRWWLFLDADTVLAPDALITMATTLDNHPEASYVYSDFQFGPKKFHLHEFSDDQLRRMNYIHTSSLLRPAAWPGFDPNLKRFQDWDLWLTMLANGHRGVWIPRELFTVADTGGMSRWVPSFVYRLPLIGQGVGNKNIEQYRAAEAVIRGKHGLS